MLLCYRAESLGHAIDGYLRVRLMVDRGWQHPVAQAQKGEDRLDGAGGAHGVADQRFVGRYRRQVIAEDIAKGVELHLIAGPRGGGMGIDRLDLIRRYTGIGDAFGDAAPHRGKMGRHEMVGVRSHAPAGDFHIKGKAAFAGKALAGQENAAGPLGDHEPAAMRGKGAADRSGRIKRAVRFGHEGGIHGGEPGQDRFHQGKIHGPADHHVGTAQFDQHGTGDHGGQAGGAGRDGGGDRAGGTGEHGNLAGDHVDAGIGIDAGQGQAALGDPLAVGVQDRIQAADGRTVGHRRARRQGRVEGQAGAFQGAGHGEQGVLEQGRNPASLLARLEKGIAQMVDVRHLPGHLDRKVGARLDARQPIDAALAGQGQAPLFIKVDAQGRDGVNADDDGRIAGHAAVHHQGRNW
ncbi:hypothetical protein DESC_10051 [Desulfosarcina cetonica]|nr:hypothetical protein DESC_10051 [Desulfosarcina cetonica]